MLTQRPEVCLPVTVVTRPVKASRAPVTVKVPAEAPLLVVAEAVRAPIRRVRFLSCHHRPKLVELAARVAAHDRDPNVMILVAGAGPGELHGSHAYVEMS